MHWWILRKNPQSDLGGSNRTFRYIGLFGVIKTTKPCLKNAILWIPLWKFEGTKTIHKYTRIQKLGTSESVDAKIIHSFNICSSFNNVDKHSTTSVVPCCAQPLAPFDCRCIAIKKNRFLILHIIHNASSTSKRVRAVFRGCATWGMPPSSSEYIAMRAYRHRRKQVAQQTRERWYVDM